MGVRLFQNEATAVLDRCTLDIALRERRDDSVDDWDERVLGTWCFDGGTLRAGAC